MHKPKMHDTVLELESISKKFSRTAKHSLKYGARDLVRNAFGFSNESNSLRPGEFWALKDITFELKRGESLGLLGLNGSGKSSLLKLINGIYLPDTGEIRLTGRVGALIELGAGFHPMLTGKENIYTKAALLGLRRKEIDKVYDDIVKFADIGDFINSTVKTYSSGMYVRLGFSVAVHANPDILLIDEVLAVGDFQFKQKCLEKMNEIRRNCSVIFVSHSLGSMKMFCDRGIVLAKGKIVFDGSIENAIRFYSEKKEETKLLPNKAVKEHVHGPLFRNEKKILDVMHWWSDEEGQATDVFQRHGKIRLNFSFLLTYIPQRLIIGVPVWNSKDEMITAFNSDMTNLQFETQPDGFISGYLDIENVFNYDSYQAAFAIVDGPEFLYREMLPLFRIDGYHPRVMGNVSIQHEWILK